MRARLEGHGFEGSTDWVSPGANTLARRETDLLEQRLIPHRIGDTAAVNDPQALRVFARVLTYPSVEDVDDSYSIILVAQRR